MLVESFTKMTKSLKHKVHQFEKGTIGKKKTVVYKCAIPGCTTYFFPERVLNQLSLCHACGKEFILSNAPSKLKAKPVCPDCSPKKERLDPIVEKTIDRLLGVG
jgi:DNA-directed RNA polymerase subunit RPC12/RpoP